MNQPNGTLGDVGRVEYRLVHLEMVLVLVQDRCKVWRNVPLAQISFWTHPMVLLGDEAQLEACFSPFGDSANLDERYVHGCIERTIGSETILDTPHGTPR